MDSKIFNQLKEFLSSLLGIDEESLYAEASLFQLGIDSSMMMTVVKEINDLFKIDLSLSEVAFQYNTLALLCDYIAAAGSEPQNPEQKTLEPKKLEQKTPAHNLLPDYAGAEMQDNLYDIFREQSETIERIFMKQLEVIQEVQHTVRVPARKAPLSDRPAQGKLNVVKNKPLTIEQNNMLKQLIKSLTEKTATSKQLAADYRRYLADLDEIAGFSMLLKEIHYQITIESGSGSEMTDVDGNQYVDIAMGFGTLILGHSPQLVLDAIQEEFKRGIQIGPRHRLIGETVKLVCELVGFDRATFTVTGTEAVMIAMKFARAYKRKEKIGLFTGCYHGHSDATLIAKMSKDDLGRTIAAGISKASLGDMMVFDYNEMSAIDEILQHKDELAAVIIEPVQSRRPEVQPVEFLSALRKVTAENGILLIFDEVITGFRCHIGGAKRYFGINPDMAVYGKAAGNGIPIGIIAGKAEIMDVADGGMWEYGDDSYPRAEQTFYAGTFFKQAFTVGAAHAIFKFYKEDNNALQERLAERTDNLVNRLNVVFQQYNVPIEAKNFTSLFRFRALNEAAYLDIFYYKLLDYGIFTWEGRTCFLSDAHQDEDIEKIVEATKMTVKDMVVAGFYGAPGTSFTSGLPDELFYD